MTISLVKGEKVSLTKDKAGNPTGLNNIHVGLGWDVNGMMTGAGDTFDLDAYVFLLGANDKVRTEQDFIFFNNTTGPGVVHQGDNLTGEGDGDDEAIKIDLSQVPLDVDKIEFTCTIYDAINKRQNFGMVNNAYIRLVNDATGEEILRYDLTEDASIQNAMVFGEMYRHNGDWKFSAVGAGFDTELSGLARSFGVAL